MSELILNLFGKQAQWFWDNGIFGPFVADGVMFVITARSVEGRKVIELRIQSLGD